ncbi:hypothetical protein [Saccharopolyspora gregorii]|uniref:Uncharacterized protein n=1 Tax=Saccharopolyspora gregorii TaxID=33914 RepID=A0ABP6RGY4_9PSEU
MYANTLYRPLKPFYNDSQWAHITDWEDELSPHYDQPAGCSRRHQPDHHPPTW